MFGFTSLNLLHQSGGMPASIVMVVTMAGIMEVCLLLFMVMLHMISNDCASNIAGKCGYDMQKVRYISHS